VSVIWEQGAAIEHDGKAVHSPVACPAELGGVLCLRCDDWFLPLGGDRQADHFDYAKQAWVVDGRYVRCGHPEAMNCQCYGRLHEGEREGSEQQPPRCPVCGSQWVKVIGWSGGHANYWECAECGDTWTWEEGGKAALLLTMSPGGLSLVGGGDGPALGYVSEHQPELRELRAVVADLREAVMPAVMAEIAILKLEGLLRAAAQRRMPMTVLCLLQLDLLGQMVEAEQVSFWQGQDFALFHSVVAVPCWMRAEQPETHDGCRYLGNDLWDCGHMDGAEACDCHVCAQQRKGGL
jgi:hypothetical protein